MARSDPRVLAAFVKTHLQVIEDRSASAASRVREAVDPADLAEIEKSSRISWLPLARHVELTERAAEVSGRREAREICRRTVLASFAQPFLKPLFAGALAIVGSDFERFVGWTPRAWPALFRDVGTLRWLPEAPDRGSLVLVDPAPEIVASEPYLEGLAGAFSALFEVTGCRGEVAVLAGGARVEFRLRAKRAGG